MAFYDYIILDGFRYKTLAKQWKPSIIRPASARLTLLGNLEATFSVGALMRWEGIIIAPHGETATTPKNGTLFGNIVDLRAALAANATLSFRDHNNGSYIAVAMGPFDEQTLLNVWNASTNKYYVRVVLTAKKA